MNRRGFTLIEVLVSLGLLTLLAGLMTQFGMTLSDRRDSLEHTGQRVQTVSMLFDRVDRALTSSDAAGRGVTVSKQELLITARRVVSSVSPEEFSVLSVQFSLADHTLTISPGTGAEQLVIPQIQAARFRAFDGQQWGAFNSTELPQAVGIEIWYLRGSEEPEADQMIPPDESEPTPPDRWRVFPLVDTLPEVGS